VTLADTPAVWSLVTTLDAAPPYAFTEVLDAWLRRSVRARVCTLLLADYAELTLVPVPEAAAGAVLGAQPIDASPAGTAFREQRLVQRRERGLLCCYLPVRVRGERLGVLEVQLPEESAGTLALLEEVAGIIGHLIIVARRYTDRFEQIRRRRDLKLAAEIQWELLPVLAYIGAHYALAGNLEPAYEIGGDTFDYAVAADSLTLTITDACGHGLRAALMGSLAITCLRNVRRYGGGLIEQAQTAAEVLQAQFGEEAFVTGLIARLDVTTGTGAIVCAGHPSPLLLRDGQVQVMPLDPALPLGTFPDTRYGLQPLALQRHDRVLLYTDGVTDAKSDSGEMFGFDRLTAMLEKSSDQSPPELVRAITTAVRRHQADQLADDATAVCLDWYGPQR
jgi:Stage II sporulation protein E (SpoIIE)